MHPTYLITGAAQGLGRAISLELAQQPTHLILLDKDMKGLETLYDEIEALKTGCEPALYPIDLKGANPDDFLALQQNLKQSYSTLNGVFLNAAQFTGFTPIEQFDLNAWYETLQVNLNANFHLIQATLPLLSSSSNGLLVAITDIEVKKHSAYYGAYGVAKAGLEQLIKTLAAESEAEQIQFYLAQLEAFQSNMRRTHFPSEDSTKLPSLQSTASHLIKICLEGLQSEYIQKL